MSEQSQALKQMNLEIQQERADIKVESSILSDRKKALKIKETEYLKQSLE
jgi:hypothetical protein